MAITKDMSILEVVQKYPDTVDVFVNAGMGCLASAALLHTLRTSSRARWHTASTSTSSSRTSTRSSAHKTSQ